MKQLKHDNILPFYGVSMNVADFCLVSPWCKNGDIVGYLKKQPNINRFNLASEFGKTALRLTLTSTHEQLSDAARGLCFIHERAVVHGSLRPVRQVSFLLMRFNAISRVTY